MNALSSSVHVSTAQGNGLPWIVQSSRPGQARAQTILGPVLSGATAGLRVGAGVPSPKAIALRPFNREISHMNKPTMPQRLEHAVQLPLGTRLIDTAGLEFEFVGTRTNPVGSEFLFARIDSRSAEPLAFSLLDGALIKFPGLTTFVTKESAL